MFKTKVKKKSFANSDLKTQIQVNRLLDLGQYDQEDLRRAYIRGIQIFSLRAG